MIAGVDAAIDCEECGRNVGVVAVVGGEDLDLEAALNKQQSGLLVIILITTTSSPVNTQRP